MIFLEFSKRFFTFYFWELECFFVLNMMLLVETIPVVYCTPRNSDRKCVKS